MTAIRVDGDSRLGYMSSQFDATKHGVDNFELIMGQYCACGIVLVAQKYTTIERNMVVPE